MTDKEARKLAECSERMAEVLVTLLALTGDEPGSVQERAWKDAEDAVEHYLTIRADERPDVFDDPAFAPPRPVSTLYGREFVPLKCDNSGFFDHLRTNDK